eukprot:scaffold2830_cov131-Cylindrotheca_fusiformis.AAC.75
MLSSSEEQQHRAAMLASPNNVYHGKVTFKNGLNEEALFAACIDAFVEDSDDGTNSLAKVKKSVDSVCDSIGWPQNDFRQSWKLVRKPNGTALVETVDKEYQPTQSNWAGLSSVQNALEKLSPDPESSIKPEWVKAILLSITTDILKCDTGDDEDLGDLSATLVFVLGTLFVLAEMGIKHLSCSPIPIQSVPVVYAKHLLAGMSVSMEDTGTDRSAKSTPFGLALLRVLSGTHRSQDGMLPPQHIVPQRMIFRGMGSGTSAFLGSGVSVSIAIAEVDGDGNCQFPDATRLWMEDGRYGSPLWMNDTVTHMETNLDDITGENLAFIIDLLLQNGAIDAWVTPIVMKKGRPAHTLHCLCRESEDGPDVDRKAKILLEIIFRHSTTLGIRIYKDMPRAKLCRSMVTVQTQHEDTTRKGLVDVKLSRFKNGEFISAKAEFDHCKEIALEANVPLEFVSEQAVAIARDDLQRSKR